MLYLIGLGLGTEKDITVAGLELVKSSDEVYLEHYTAILGIEKDKLEEFYGRKVEYATRTFVESGNFLPSALTKNISLLIVGDPFAATTHHDILLRCKELGVQVKVIHNASIMSAVGITGLQLYRFGQCISMCFFRDNYKPTSWYKNVGINVNHGFHTLILLDIKVHEQSFDNMAKGIEIFEPPRYMTINQCIAQMLEIESMEQKHYFNQHSQAFGIARLGQYNQQVISGTLEELSKLDFGGPLHSLVLCGSMHYIELEMYDYYHWNYEGQKKKRQEEKEEEERKAKEKEQELQVEAAQRLLKQQEFFEQQKLQVEEEKKKKKQEDEEQRRKEKERREKEEQEEQIQDIEPLF